MKRIIGVLVAVSLFLGLGMPLPAQASSVKAQKALAALKQKIQILKQKKYVAKPVVKPSPKAVKLKAAVTQLCTKIKAAKAKAAANKAARDAQTEQRLKNVRPGDRGSIGGPLGY